MCGPELESYKCLTGFPIFPEGVKSSVARFNTKDIWDQLKDKENGKVCLISFASSMVARMLILGSVSMLGHMTPTRPSLH